MNVFYLHGGPGFSTVFERDRFPDVHNVYWWQQPPAAPRAMRPYLDLQDAALAEFERFVADAGDLVPEPVTLLAASFGAQLALHLAQQMPQAIERIVLLAPTWNPELALLRLARRVQAAQETASQHQRLLAEVVDAYDRAPDRARFWDVMAALWQIPDALRSYFSPGAAGSPGDQAAQRFLSLLQQPGAFDAPSSAAIADDFAALDRQPVRSPFDGHVSILYGAHDPMADPAVDTPLWRSIFPQAAVRTVPAGHFPLLELTLEECLA